MNYNLIDFSLWVDYVEKTFVETKFKDLIGANIINGATSNPTIFKDSFTKSDAYIDIIAEMSNLSKEEKYEKLVVSEIKRAAIALQDVYNNSKKKNGFISVEINPLLAHDYDGSIQEAKRLYELINEPNVMIKIPATDVGCNVIASLLSDGIDVNATLIFSKSQVNTILHNISSLKTHNNSLVISIFVSRFDRLLNTKLPKKMQNMVGIMNAAMLYNEILKSKLLNVRALFASTGVKSDQGLPLDYYIASLLAPHSINTAPLATIEAFCASPQTQISMPYAESKINGFFEELKKYIDIDLVSSELLSDGLTQFENSYKELLESL